MTEEPQQATPGSAFLLEEYKNIAATHDKLRDMLGRLFNYFLLLSAFPFTVAGVVFRNGGFDLSAAPLSLHFLFLLVGIGHLVLALTIVDARLSQYRYARTVNAIRRYFADRHPELKSYLFLPTDQNIPSWDKLGYIEYQVNLICFTGAVFTAYGVWAIRQALGRPLAVVVVTVAVVGYLVAYGLLRGQIQKHFEDHKGIR
jgi:hypothetical protein